MRIENPVTHITKETQYIVTLTKNKIIYNPKFPDRPNGVTGAQNKFASPSPINNKFKKGFFKTLPR